MTRRSTQKAEAVADVSDIAEACEPGSRAEWHGELQLVRRWILGMASTRAFCRELRRSLGGDVDALVAALGVPVLELEREGGEALPQRIADLRKGLPPVSRSAVPLVATVERLGRSLGLDPVEIDVLAVLGLASQHEALEQAFAVLENLTARGTIQHLALALDHSSKAVLRALRPEARLRTSGLVVVDASFFDGSGHYQIAPVVVRALTDPDGDTATLLSSLLQRAAAPAHDIEEFRHLGKPLRLVEQVLGAALEREGTRMHVLLHGPSGTGKTELVRALAAALDAQLYEVQSEDAEGAPLSGMGRLASYRLTQQILGPAECSTSWRISSPSARSPVPGRLARPTSRRSSGGPSRLRTCRRSGCRTRLQPSTQPSCAASTSSWRSQRFRGRPAAPSSPAPSWACPSGRPRSAAWPESRTSPLATCSAQRGSCASSTRAPATRVTGSSKPHLLRTTLLAAPTLCRAASRSTSPSSARRLPSSPPSAASFAVAAASSSFTACLGRASPEYPDLVRSLQADAGRALCGEREKPREVGAVEGEHVVSPSSAQELEHDGGSSPGVDRGIDCENAPSVGARAEIVGDARDRRIDSEVPAHGGLERPPFGWGRTTVGSPVDRWTRRCGAPQQGRVYGAGCARLRVRPRVSRRSARHLKTVPHAPRYLMRQRPRNDGRACSTSLIASATVPSTSGQISHSWFHPSVEVETVQVSPTSRAAAHGTVASTIKVASIISAPRLTSSTRTSAATDGGSRKKHIRPTSSWRRWSQLGSLRVGVGWLGSCSSSSIEERTAPTA